MTGKYFLLKVLLKITYHILIFSQITSPLENSTLFNNDTLEEIEEYVPPRAALYFAHSSTVLPFLALLGLNKDEYPLTHSNFEEAMDR